MEDVPNIIDIDDDLERARAEADGDIAEDIDSVRERIDTYSDRNHPDREGILEVVENELLRLEEETDGTATERLRAARNRVRIYRDSREDTTEAVSVLEAKARPADAGADFETDETNGDETEFWLTLANDDDEERTVTIELTCYAEEGEELADYSSESIAVAAGEQETLTIVTSVPETTDYFAVSAAEVDEIRH